MPGLRVAELTLAPGHSELRLEGEVDLAVVGELQEAIGRAPVGNLLVDLEGCEFIDSTAIAALLMAHRDGHRVLLHGASGQVLRVLRITGVDALGLVFENRAEALVELDHVDRFE
jgi:anti-anti-sigma factor